MTITAGPELGIVIPTLNEEGHLPRLLADLGELRIRHSVVVVDGGSRDRTVDRARGAGVAVVRSPPGRGTQLRTGVGALTTSWLLFLHADTRLPPAACRVLEGWLETPDPHAVAHFRFGLDGRALHHRLIEVGQRLREWSTGLVFGDQGLVVHRGRLEAVGGVPDLPLMEDVELLRRLRRSGPIHRLDAVLPTSPRRYDGPAGMFAPARNAVLLGLFMAGVPPTRLAGWYRPEGREPMPQTRPMPQAAPLTPTGPTPAAEPVQPLEPISAAEAMPPDEPTRPGGQAGVALPPGARDTVLIFARAPVRGQVKTRLAAGIGEMEATEIYRRLGRRVVDQIRSQEYGVTICHEPPGGGAAVREWLGEVDLEFQPQHPGDLGIRMAAALDSALAAGAPAACVIGTDAPEVDGEVVREAFASLHDGADVVLGPALDGGYYLVGLKEARPELFVDVPWSTDRVLGITLERCHVLQLRVELLRPLRDVDTVDDLEALFPEGVRPVPVGVSPAPAGGHPPS